MAPTRDTGGTPDFRIDAERVGGALVVAPRGDIDLSTADEVAAALAGRRDSERAVVLDLRAVDFLDTSGLRLVVEEAERARARGYRFAIVRGPAHVQRIFAIAGVVSDELLVDDPAQVTGGDA